VELFLDELEDNYILTRKVNDLEFAARINDVINSFLFVTIIGLVSFSLKKCKNK